jgi:hypothetical protein
LNDRPAPASFSGAPERLHFFAKDIRARETNIAQHAVVELEQQPTFPASGAPAADTREQSANGHSARLCVEPAKPSIDQVSHFRHSPVLRRNADMRGVFAPNSLPIYGKIIGIGRTFFDGNQTRR